MTAAPRSWSRALVGSSTRSTDGSFISARAMFTRCRWPPDSWCGRRCAWSARPTASRRSRARSRTDFGGRPDRWAITWSCSTALSEGSRFGCWKTIPMCSRRSSALAAAVSFPVSVPATTTRPESGVTRVAATARRLDLPEPDGPTTAVSVPAGTVRETASRAVSRPSPSG